MQSTLLFFLRSSSKELPECTSMAQGKEEGMNKAPKIILLNDNHEKEESKSITVHELSSIIKERIADLNLSFHELATIIEEPLYRVEKIKEDFEEIELEVLIKIINVLNINLQIEIKFETDE